MNDNIRVSDADRERVADRLREHYAEGRLTSDELDERITSTLNAKTYRDLRAVMTDLPEGQQMAAQPGPAGQRPFGPQAWSGRPVMRYRRGPRLLPLIALAVILAIVLPGAGLVFFTLLKIAAAFFLVAIVMAVITASHFRRRIRRMARAQAFPGRWQQFEWHH